MFSGAEEHNSHREPTYLPTNSHTIKYLRNNTMQWPAASSRRQKFELSDAYRDDKTVLANLVIEYSGTRNLITRRCRLGRTGPGRAWIRSTRGLFYGFPFNILKKNLATTPRRNPIMAENNSYRKRWRVSSQLLCRHYIKFIIIFYAHKSRRARHYNSRCRDVNVGHMLIGPSRRVGV